MDILRLQAVQKPRSLAELCMYNISKCLSCPIVHLQEGYIFKTYPVAHISNKAYAFVELRWRIRGFLPHKETSSSTVRKGKFIYKTGKTHAGLPSSKIEVQIRTKTESVGGSRLRTFRSDFRCRFKYIPEVEEIKKVIIESQRMLPHAQGAPKVSGISLRLPAPEIISLLFYQRAGGNF